MYIFFISEHQEHEENNGGDHLGQGFTVQNGLAMIQNEGHLSFAQNLGQGYFIDLFMECTSYY